MRLVFGAKTRAELERLVDDVLVPTDDRDPIASGTATVIPGGGRRPGPGGEDGTRRIRSILGGGERKGRWRLAASCSVVNVLGGSKLDLSEAETRSRPRGPEDHQRARRRGDHSAHRPERGDLRIRDSRRPRIDVGDERPDPGGPVVRLRLVSILSGVKVQRGPQLTRKQRQELERRERELEPGP